MTFGETTTRLTNDGISAMLMAAIGAAKAMDQPQYFVIVDPSRVALASFRMAGSRYLSLKSTAAKARTAASIGHPSDSVPAAVRPVIVAATGGGTARWRSDPRRRCASRWYRLRLGRTGRSGRPCGAGGDRRR